MRDIVKEIIDAAELNSSWEPDHPQYIEGALYLTRQQWNSVLSHYHSPSNNQYAWGIRVHIIEFDKPVKLPSGKVLFYSKTLNHLYVFDKDIAHDAGLIK